MLSARAPPAKFGGFTLHARFSVERRVQDVSRGMRCECFRGKALNAAQQQFVQTAVGAR